MAAKQTAAEDNPTREADFEFPFEWVSQHNDGAGVSFAMSKELASKFAQLKVMNEAADGDANSVLESLVDAQKKLERSVDGYKSVMNNLPLGISDLPPDTLENWNTLMHSNFDVASGDSAMEELIATNYNKELARMETVSQSLDGILQQIDSMKQQFLTDFGEGDDDEENVDLQSSECVELLEEKVAACKEEFDEEEADKFFTAFKEYKEVKEYLDKLEKEKKYEAKLDSALAKYKDLPPDLLLAKECLKKKEKEMKDLNAEIEFLKNHMADGALDMFGH